MTRRAPALALTLAFLLAALTVTATAAAEAAPQPTSMAAVGDSITQAASTGGSLGADAPQNSWSTGWSSSVDSHAERLGLTGAAHNLSVSGAKVANLNAQMLNVAAISPDPGYLTVLIGGNDLCTDTLEGMTSEAAFASAFQQAMTTIYNQSPGTYVYVVSIPDAYQLWSLFKGSWWARFIWSSAKICQSLLASPTSTKQVDVDRRLAVRARNMAYNDIMAGICDSEAFSARCHHDGGAVFGTKLQTSDVSGDYFHPSASGQNRIAQTSWNAGYTFGTDPEPDPDPEPEPNAPTAAFSVDCTLLTCDFTDASSDTDGTITLRSWTFGDGNTATDTDPSHTYGAGGTYTVTLTVTDDDGATGSTSKSVTVNSPPTASFTSSCSDLSCSFTDTSTDGDGSIALRSWNFGDGNTATGTDPSHTYGAGGAYTVTLTVTDDDGATGTTSGSVTVAAPPGGITLAASAYKVKGVKTADLTWSGATSTSVDVFRDGVRVTTTANDGFYTDSPGGRGGGSYTYKVCQADTSTCSADVSVSY